MYNIYCQNIWNTLPAADRMVLIRELISDFDADICLFQECSPYTVRKCENAISELMADKYSEACEYMIPINYTPVFYKRDKFELIDEGYLLYDGLNDYESKSVSWAVLKDKESGKMLAAASTHFWWMFRGEEDTKQRIANADELRKVCEDIVSKYNAPVIIGGDFNNGLNSVQGSEPYEYMVMNGFIDFRNLAQNSTDKYTHRDCYDGVAYDNLLPTQNLDYIFLYGSKAVEVSLFDVLYSKPALESSDHCPLVAKLDIN